MNKRNVTLSRREILALAATAATAAPREMAGAATRMRFGLTSYQWGSDWDIPAMIANCVKAGAFGLELRTSAGYKHGVEIETGDFQRSEVKRRFADSPVKLAGIASPTRFDSPVAAELTAAMESAKAHVKLAHDVGATGVRVFPNNFHPGVPPEKTMDQIARSLNELGRFASGYGQMVRVENHGTAGKLATLHQIMQGVEQKNVRIKLNADARDAAGGEFAKNFALIQDRLSDTLHMHKLSANDKFPYQLQWDLLTAQGWDGWCLVERSDKVPDRVQALIEERQAWEKMIAESQRRA